MLITEGFRDVLLIARQKRWELYDNAHDKPQHVVPRRHYLGRLRSACCSGDGGVHHEAGRGAGPRGRAADAHDEGIETVAVCFHCTVTPIRSMSAAPEQIIGEVAPPDLPGLTVMRGVADLP